MMISAHFPPFKKFPVQEIVVSKNGVLVSIVP
jgi:hypothetical protein